MIHLYCRVSNMILTNKKADREVLETAGSLLTNTCSEDQLFVECGRGAVPWALSPEEAQAPACEWRSRGPQRRGSPERLLSPAEWSCEQFSDVF